MKMRPVYAIVEREIVRLLRQRSRLLAAMVRPLIWLLVIGAGFDSVLGRQAGYQHQLVPGVLGMTLLFGGMLAALTTVYDKESGVMRMLLLAPMQRSWIVIAKLASSVISALLQAFMLLVVLALLGYLRAGASPLLLVAGLLATALASACIGMLVAVFTRSLENFASVMNFVIFPVFFLSGSLYPVQHLPALMRLAVFLNPYAYGTDLLKHALHAPTAAGLQADFSVATDLAVVLAFAVAATFFACYRFASDAVYEGRVRLLAR